MNNIINPSLTPKIKIGRTNIEVLPLGIGAMTWGKKVMMTAYGGTRDPEDEEEAFKTCLEAGITFFDTAEMYGSGNSELRLGELAQNSEAIIATKYAPSLPFMPFLPRPAKQLQKSLDNSLIRLRRSKVDLYQIHYHVPLVSNKALMDQLAVAVKSGKTLAVGVSNYSVEQMREAYEALRANGIALASNQVQYSLLYRRPEVDGVLDTCRELGVTLIAYMPLAMGALTGKYKPGSIPSDWMRRRMGNTFHDREIKAFTKINNKLAEIGNQYGKTPAQVALRWVIDRGALPIVGAKNASQARENIGALSFSLTNKDITTLEESTTGWFQGPKWKYSPTYTATD
jgi:aryl-alcohol dehydrogenase-like predicted oxidoreductase